MSLIEQLNQVIAYAVKEAEFAKDGQPRVIGMWHVLQELDA